MNNLVLAFLLMFPWSETAVKPDWVDGVSAKFPRVKYMIGVGSADDRPTAESRARAELTRSFSVYVTSRTDVRESETVGQEGKSKTSTYSASVDDRIQSTSTKVLEGVEIADFWVDPDSKQCYALAVLDRSKAASALKDKIQGIDLQSVKWMVDVTAAADKITAVRAAMRLVSLQKERTALNGDLRILEGNGAPNAVNEARANAAIASALGNLIVRVHMTGEGAEPVEAGIITALGSFGLAAKKGDAEVPADLAVSAQVTTEPYENIGGDKRWQWMRSRAKVEAKDLATGRVFLMFEVNDRQSARAIDEAQRRTLNALAEKAAAKITSGIAAYLESR